MISNVSGSNLLGIIGIELVHEICLSGVVREFSGIPCKAASHLVMLT